MILDVIVIGGSYAGLSAAMTLGRSLRNVLVIDSGFPCNSTAPHAHNFLTQDGKAPLEISTTARQQVAFYKTVQFQNDFAVGAQKIEEGFEVSTKSGASFTSKKLILATGIKDIIPPISGFAECWGISIIHCPYCHGYEFRHQETAILANGETAMHLCSLVSNLTKSVAILANGKAEFTEEQVTKLKRNNVRIIESEVSDFAHEKGHVTQVNFKDATTQAFNAVYAALPFAQSEIPILLGCELNEHGYINVDGLQKTSVAGVFACGDSTSPMRSIANAVYSGNLTGAVLNRELAAGQF